MIRSTGKSRVGSFLYLTFLNSPPASEITSEVPLIKITNRETNTIALFIRDSFVFGRSDSCRHDSSMALNKFFQIVNYQVGRGYLLFNGQRRRRSSRLPHCHTGSLHPETRISQLVAADGSSCDEKVLAPLRNQRSQRNSRHYPLSQLLR